MYPNAPAYNRKDTGGSDSTHSSTSSESSRFGLKSRKVRSWEKQAQAEERAAHPRRHQWKCSRYNLTWNILEDFLRRRFPNETFKEHQVSWHRSGEDGAATNSPSGWRLLDHRSAGRANTQGPRGRGEAKATDATNISTGQVSGVKLFGKAWIMNHENEALVAG